MRAGPVACGRSGGLNEVNEAASWMRYRAVNGRTTMVIATVWVSGVLKWVGSVDLIVR